MVEVTGDVLDVVLVVGLVELLVEVAVVDVVVDELVLFVDPVEAVELVVVAAAITMPDLTGSAWAI
ncbi:MAG: hypothetical protein ACXWT3_12370 [Methylococcaceae bacterium]